ncbi:hypothetical protein ACJ72_03816 [Emergomyces africanus]|uniref:Uncharacterized protein n=1 Tax=Emergomyces africanus TaxID=1955775 RepID=A0A1B7NYJ0_9EURO|nr:hypothetical protein ACJ72_03816 [Emergomyces africanus]
MADIRALLRNELASRRATDPNNPSTAKPAKKRKLEPEQQDDVRKKSKATQEDIAQKEENQRGQPGDSGESGKAAVPDTSILAEPTKIGLDEGADEQKQENSPRASESFTQPATSPRQAEPQPPPAQSQFIDEDEWALFEREVAAPTKMTPAAAPAAFTAGATISAAPLSAAELAEREKIDQQAQLRMREQEMSFEKEDAARLLEEEFDEMDQLEDRVRRLKEMRDEIRRRVARDGQPGVVEGKGADDGVGEEGMGQDESGGERDEEDEEDEDEDEDEEEDEGWDNWRFR